LRRALADAADLAVPVCWDVALFTLLYGARVLVPSPPPLPARATFEGPAGEEAPFVYVHASVASLPRPQRASFALSAAAAARLSDGNVAAALAAAAGTSNGTEGLALGGTGIDGVAAALGGRSGLDWLCAGLSRSQEAYGVVGTQANVWVGGRGVTTHLHTDAFHNLYAQVSGRKRFILMPPRAVTTPNAAAARRHGRGSRSAAAATDGGVTPHAGDGGGYGGRWLHTHSRLHPHAHQSSAEGTDAVLRGYLLWAQPTAPAAATDARAAATASTSVSASADGSDGPWAWTDPHSGLALASAAPGSVTLAPVWRYLQWLEALAGDGDGGDATEAARGFGNHSSPVSAAAFAPAPDVPRACRRPCPLRFPESVSGAARAEHCTAWCAAAGAAHWPYWRAVITDAPARTASALVPPARAGAAVATASDTRLPGWRPLVVDLSAGDVLYLPPYWAHHVIALGAPAVGTGAQGRSRKSPAAAAADAVSVSVNLWCPSEAHRLTTILSESTPKPYDVRVGLISVYPLL
jgi:hypothetical protein